jgi:hypothetical protein
MMEAKKKNSAKVLNVRSQKLSGNQQPQGKIKRAEQDVLSPKVLGVVLKEEVVKCVCDLLAIDSVYCAGLSK